MRATWWVYMLECADGSLYSGATTDPQRRLAQHNAGRASRYTRSRLPVRLVYEEHCADRSSALRREADLKRLDAGTKRRLVHEQTAKRQEICDDAQTA